jgi:hypothetical protein
MTNLYVVDAGRFTRSLDDGVLEDDYAIELIVARSPGQARYVMTQYYEHLTFTSPMHIIRLEKNYEVDLDTFGDFFTQQGRLLEAQAKLDPDNFDEIRAQDELDQIYEQEDPWNEVLDGMENFFATHRPPTGPDQPVYHPFEASNG